MTQVESETSIALISPDLLIDKNPALWSEEDQEFTLILELGAWTPDDQYRLITQDLTSVTISTAGKPGSYQSLTPAETDYLEKVAQPSFYRQSEKNKNHLTPIKPLEYHQASDQEKKTTLVHIPARTPLAVPGCPEISKVRISPEQLDKDFIFLKLTCIPNYIFLKFGDVRVVSQNWDLEYRQLIADVPRADFDPKNVFYSELYFLYD